MRDGAQIFIDRPNVIVGHFPVHGPRHYQQFEPGVVWVITGAQHVFELPESQPGRFPVRIGCDVSGDDFAIWAGKTKIDSSGKVISGVDFSVATFIRIVAWARIVRRAGVAIVAAALRINDVAAQTDPRPVFSVRG